MATKAAAKKVVKRRRERKVVEKGAAHIRSSFNNTMVTVTDTNGRTVAMTKGNTIDLSRLSAGMYVVKATSATGTATMKVVR